MNRVSFIVIGRNVARTIEACLNSTLDVCAAASLTNFEVIYVDSQSNDNTLSIVSNLSYVKCYRIRGSYNAAIARNIGAREATGDILFFVDGDMTLEQGFLNKALNEDNSLKYPFMSGDILNINYDSDGKLLGESNYFNTPISSDRYEITTGGVFIIEAPLWKRYKGMNTKLKRGEDIDLGLRLSQDGVRLLRTKDRIVKHHTISYQDSKRGIVMLLNGDFCYAGVTSRFHIFNRNSLGFFIRNNYSAILLFACFLLSLFIHHALLLLYVVMVAARTAVQKNHLGFSFMRYFIFNILFDLEILIGFFAVYPSKKLLVYDKIPVTHEDK